MVVLLFLFSIISNKIEYVISGKVITPAGLNSHGDSYPNKPGPLSL